MFSLHHQKLIAIQIFLIGFSFIYSQTVSITGKVVGRGDTPVNGCAVSLVGTAFSTTTNALGEFVLTDASPVKALPIYKGPEFKNGKIHLDIIRGLQNVSVKIFNTEGRKVAVPYNKMFKKGEHVISLSKLLQDYSGSKILVYQIDIGEKRYLLKSYQGMESYTFGKSNSFTNNGLAKFSQSQLAPDQNLNISCLGRPLRTIIVPTTQETLGQIKIFQKPNFVIVFTDDQGYADLGTFGSGTAPAGSPWLDKDRIAIPTPRIDQMADEGLKFTSFYAQTYCGPSRAQLMTGSYAARIAKKNDNKGTFNGLFNGTGGVDMHPSEITIAEVLKGVGYSTAIFGKWHLGIDAEYRPLKQGFDYWYGARYSNDPGWFPLWENDSFIENYNDMAHVTQNFTVRAVDYIRQNQDKPFFVWLAHTMPHKRIGASENFIGKTTRGLYGDVINELDWYTGMVLDSIKAYGLDENTVVAFLSDNGHWGSADDAGTGYPLRGGKISQWEGGFRVPCVIRAPGIIPPGSISPEIATSMDFMPTFAKLAGATMPTDRIIDGKDIEPLLRMENGATSPHAAHYFYKTSTMKAVRQGKWKLHITYDGNNDIQPSELYDLESDVGERNDVSGSNSSVVSQIMALAQSARADIGDQYVNGTGWRQIP